MKKRESTYIRQKKNRKAIDRYLSTNPVTATGFIPIHNHPWYLAVDRDNQLIETSYYAQIRKV